MVINTYKADVNLQQAVEMQQGNLESLEELYDKYAPALSGIINKMTNDAWLNESILKNSFVKAWKQIHAFNPANSSLFTWLINIARHTALEEIRMQKKKNSTSNYPVYNSQQNDTQELTAFELMYYRGLNYGDTAVTLQTTVETVKENIRETVANIKIKTLV